MARFQRQLGAILWKNVLLKRQHWIASTFEVAIPVLFIGLLVWIKSICTKIDSPSVAYYCGQTEGFAFYTESLFPYINNITSMPLLQCLSQPPQCQEENYFRGGLQTIDPSLPPLYTEYGYTASGKGYPFYGITVSDESLVYDQVNQLLAITNVTSLANNPSQSLNRITETYSKSSALLVVCPAQPAPQNPSLAAAAYDLYQALLQQLTWPGNHSQTLLYFNSQEELTANITSTNYGKDGSPKVASAIVLNSVDTVASRWDYSIRVNFTQNFELNMDAVGCLYHDCETEYTVPPTQFIVNPFVRPAKADFLYGYTYSGFSTLQKAVDDYILNTASSKGPIDTTISLGLFPETAFHSDDFLTIIAASLALFFILAFLYPVSRYIRALVLEKETKIKETMKIMGLSSLAANLSWIITMVIQSAFTVLLMTLLGSNTVFTYSSSLLIFLFLFIFSLSLVMFCFLISTLFSKSKTAATVGTVIYFASFFPYYALTGSGSGTHAKASACLLAPTCLGLGSDVIAAFEGGLMGLHWNNIDVMPGETNFSYNWTCFMLLVDVITYGLLAAYLEAVLPSEYGTQLPFHFPFMPSYWRGLIQGHGRPSRHHSFDDDGGEGACSPSEPFLGGADGAERQEAMEGPPSGPMIEAIDPELKRQEEEGRSLSLRKLRKVFKTASGERVAVASLSMDLYEGQIFVLLGHNGAGKSTTISMLTGLIPPTSGEAWVRGKRLTHEMSAIRQSMGVCQQADTLWSELTVTQHLNLFAALKGVRKGRVKEEVRKMIQEVGLTEKAHVPAGSLSGGMKRKLCLAMALIGDSKVVFLDEPTSGMDPYSRRSIWTVLERNKRGRIILLTTHFMDEADMLGDRIAICADGHLKAMGSSLFLKSHYGVGYTLVAVKENQAVDSKPIIDVVKAAIPEAAVTSQAGAELSFRLPFSASSTFPTLFKELDDRRSSLQLSTYGISVTTLLEVFLRIGEDRLQRPHLHHPIDLQQQQQATENQQQVALALHDGTSSSSYESGGTDARSSGDPQEDGLLLGGSSITSRPPLPPPPPYPATKLESGTAAQGGAVPPLKPTFQGHMKALLTKRLIYAKRDRKSQCCQLVIPALLVLFGLSLIKLLGNPLIQPDLILTPEVFNTHYAPEQKNPLPVLAKSTVGQQIMQELNVIGPDGQSGLPAQAIDVASVTPLPVDQFYSCAVGASELHTMSNYLATPGFANTGASRYGALTVAESTTSTDFTYNLLVNASGLHSAGIYMNLASNAILRVLKKGNESTLTEGFSPPPLITTHNFPLPLTYEEQRASFLIQANTASTFVLIAMCFIPASIAIFIVKETESKAKHQQIISGVSLWAYWLSNFIWDVTSWLAPFLIILALMFAFGIKSYTTGEAAVAFVAVFLAFAPAATSFTYMWTFAFKTHSAAQTVILFICFLTGLVLSITSFVLSLIESTRAVNLKLRYVFRIFPAFCFGDALLQLALCVDDTCPNITAEGISIIDFLSPLNWNVTMADIVFLLIEAVVYFLLTLLIEYARAQPWIAALFAWRPRHWLKRQWNKRWRKRPQSTYRSADSDSEDEDQDAVVEGGRGKDEDVRAEEQRLLSGASKAAKDVIRLEKLRKVYQTPSGRPNVAVQGLCFGIPRGEIFAFLGINGAGKTTTLSILSGEIIPTSGSAYIAGLNIATDQIKIRRKIGYCPQFSALLESLTTKEHLILFARIKGVPEGAISSSVQAKLEEMDLYEFADKEAGSLSGGNQRKLSVAIATIGDPPVLFLDEPSTGMDPKARRFMWDVISSIRARQSSIILTTHSMEEAEALASRIAIMVNGRLKCIGTPQHLKSKFGEGFELEVKMKSPDSQELETYSRLLKKKLTDSLLEAELGSACEALGKKEMVEEIKEKGSEAVLKSILNVEGGRLSVRTFVEWWAAEQRASRLQDFLVQSFSSTSSEEGDAAGGGVVKLIERPSWFNFRYSLPGGLQTGGGMSLGTMFEKLEAGKREVGIAEYSLGQTQIEVIFNRMASEGAAAGHADE